MADLYANGHAEGRAVPLDVLPAYILATAREGFRFFPVKAHEKAPPLIKDWSTAATPDVEQLFAWAMEFPGCNWGLACGPDSGVYVLDIDGEDGLKTVFEWEQAGLDLPCTRIHRTNRGLHRVFRWPQGFIHTVSAGFLGKGVDTRGDRGYVLVPGSMHPSGILYTCDDVETPLADVPSWLIELHAKPSASYSRDRNASLVNIAPGQREPALFSLAGKLHSLGLPQEAVVEGLNILNCHFAQPHEESRVREIAAKIQRYPAGTPSSLPRPKILHLADVQSAAVEWMWENRLAFGMLTMLSGDPAAGKTFIALRIAADLSNGLIPGTEERCEPLRSLFLTKENSPTHVIRPRFEAMGGDVSRLDLLEGSVREENDQEIRTSLTLNDVELLNQAINYTGARLVVIDPLQSYLGAKVDAYRFNETRPVMDGLIQIAEETHVSILLIRHLTKGTGGKGIYRGQGSIDLTAAVRVELLAGIAPDDPARRALVGTKNNLGPEAAAIGYEISGAGLGARMDWTGESDLSVVDILGSNAKAGRQFKTASAIDYLREELQAGPQLVRELIQRSGIPERTLQRAAQEIDVKKSRDGRSGPFRWGL